MIEREIFLQLLEIPVEADRVARLAEVCAEDPALRGRVESLLRCHDAADDFLERPFVLVPGSASDLYERGLADHAAETEEEPLSFLQPSVRPDALGRLGRYEILELLGRGGFGIVFRAFDTSLERVVAIKVLAPQLAAFLAHRKRFLREARAAAGVRHEHVVQIHAVEEAPTPFLVMEFIPGETLQQRLDRDGPLPIAEVVDIGRGIALGLEAAHERGLIHRDVKPANVLIERGSRDRVKLTDFGLARAVDDDGGSQSGFLSGTPAFMSPEQADGAALDHRSDLFSLGSLLYTVVTGRRPFPARNSIAVLRQIVDESHRPIHEIDPSVPPALAAIIDRLLAKDPAARCSSAGETARMLEAVSTDPIGAASSRSPSPPSRSFLARGRIVLAAGLLLAFAGLGFSEAGGITNLGGIVIRLFSPEGTLVVEVDDPDVEISIDGEDLVITGAGAREIRLKSGLHSFEAKKGSKVIRREPITVTRNGRVIVRVTEEAAGPGAAPGTLAAAAAPPGGVEIRGGPKAEKLAERLKALNPGFQGLVEFTDPQVVVIRATQHLTDISPILDIPTLGRLECTGDSISDISPVRNVQKLYELSVRGTSVSDLSPLKGLKIQSLELTSSHVSDLSPLVGLPLGVLEIAYTAISDLRPLKGMPIRGLNLQACRFIDDLSPVRGFPLRELNIRETRVSDLAPLEGMKLVKFVYEKAPVRDVGVLKGMPLEEVTCDFDPARDAAVFRSIPTLRLINGKPVAEFWKSLEPAK